MDRLLDFFHLHQGVILLIAYAIFSNAVAALPTVESMADKTRAEVFYGWFYRFTTGLAQMIPKQAKPPEPKP